MNKIKIELDAAINKAKTKKKINKEIKDIQKSLNKIELKTSETNSVSGLTRANQEASESLIAQNKVLKQTTTASKAASIAAKGLSTVGNSIASIVIDKIVSVVVSGIDDLIHAKEIAIEKANQITDSINERNENFSNKSDWVTNNAPIYEQLIQGIDNQGQNLSLTNDEFSEYQALTAEIAKNFPTLILGYNESGNAVLNLGESSIKATAELQNLLKVEEELNNIKTASTLPDVFAGTVLSVNDAKKSGNDYKTQAEDLQFFLNDIIKLENNDLGDLLEIDSKNAGLTNSVSQAAQEFLDSLDDDRRIALQMDGFNANNYDEIKGVNYYPLAALTNSEKAKFKKQIALQTKSLTAEISDSLYEAQRNEFAQNANAELIWTDTLPNFISAMKSKAGFQNLDSLSQKMAVKMVGHLPIDIINELDKNDPYAWIRENIVNKLNEIDDTDKAKISTAYSSLLELNPNDLSDTNQHAINKYVKTISSVLGKNFADTKLQLGFNEDENLSANYNSIIDNAAKKFSNQNKGNRFDSQRKSLQDFATEFSIDTLDELALFNKCIEKSDLYADAVREYKNELETTNKDSGDAPIADPTKNTSALETLENFQRHFFSLDTIMASLEDDNKIDLSEINALGDSLKELDGINLDAVNDSLAQLLDATNVAEGQSAINALCNEYIRCSGILDTLNENNADSIIAGLESMGISNAQELVSSIIAAQKYALAHGYESLTNITWGEISALIKEDDIDSESSNFLANLALSKFNINNTPLNTDEDVSNIIALANAAGASAEYVNALRLALINLQNAKTRQENVKKLPTAGVTSAMAGAMTNANVNVAEQEVQDTITDLKKNISDNSLNPIDFYSKYPDDTTSNNTPNDTGGGSGLSNAATAAEVIKESFYEVFDWMERKINLLERVAKKAIGHVVDSLQYASDGKYVDKTFRKINDQMSQNAYMIKRYQQSANDVGLSPEWKKLVEEGGDIDYSEITDEQLSKDIKAYEDWYKKSLDCKEANEALKDSIKDVANAFANAPIDKAAEKLEKYESAAALLDAKVENAVSAKDKNKLINDKSKNINSTLSADKKAYNDSASNVSKYSKKITGQKAAKGADKKQKDKYSDLMKKVKAAVKSSKKIDDKTLNAIYDYCTSVKSYAWYENCLAYNSSIDAKASAKKTYDLYAETSKSDKADLIKEKFDNVSAEYENKIDLIGNSMQSLENQKAIVEAKGQMLDAGYYETQKNINAEMLGQYQAEKSSLESLLPTIQAGTDDWFDAKNQIQECADAISECEKNTLEYNNAINELNVEMFEKAAGQINRIKSEQEFLAKLMSHEKQFDDNGSLTEYGLATLGTYTTSYYASVENANRDKTQLDQLKQMLASNNLGTFNSTDQLQARIDELYSTWQDDISETYSSQESIFDMMSEKFDAELDAVKELIDAKKEALNTEKDLYEYQNQIAEKTKSITTLQKQIAAYKGDTSQEGSAKLQKLQVSLQAAQKDLKDTEYEKYISDQEDLLDKLYTDYSETIQKRLEDFQEVVASGLLTANENSSDILDVLSKVSDENGYKMQYSPEGQSTLQGYVSQITSTITSTQTPDIPSPDSTGPEQPEQKQLLQPNWELESGRNNSGFDKGGFFMEDPRAIKAEKYIKDHLTKSNKKKSEYSDLNQGFYTKYSGKILSSEELRELAKIVGVEYNGASKSSNLYKKLHDLNIAGFSTGGIVREMRGKVQENGDSLLASFRPNETVLTEEFTKLLPNTVNLMKDFIDIEPHNYSTYVPNRNISNASVSDVQFNFELNGCQNAADVLAEIKSNSKVQRAIQAVTIDQMLGKSRLSVNSIK